jgi:exodeoxyribonuclease-5
VQAAIAVLGRRLVPPPPPLLLEIEAQRMGALVLLLLAAEGERAPFEVEACEQSLEASLGGVRLDVRIDRVDRLVEPTGEGDRRGPGARPFVVLDYKSGRADAFDPLDERPAQAQLLAYALLVEGEPAALATVHLRGGGLEWRGAARSAGVLPGLGRNSVQPEGFAQWLAHWRRVVPRLAQDFAAGVATVSPRVRACDRCHLAALCRVDADALATAELAVAEAAGEGDGEADARGGDG